MTSSKRRLCVIVNPVSGVDRSALEIIERFIETHRDQLDVTLCHTRAGGDATRFAAQAAQNGVDLVAAYGGDGTMMEAAIGLVGTGIPLVMLPGGTANVMAIDLGIPNDLEGALALAAAPDVRVRSVDMGKLDGEYFLLRAGIGYEAEMSAQAARGEKSRKGRLAYFENALRRLRNLRQTTYILTVDGETHVRRGVTCMICNSSGVGIPNLRLTYNSDVSDGYLDVIVIRNMQPGTILKTILHMLRSILPGPRHLGRVHVDHWQAKHVTVQMKRRQFVARDGEPLKRSKRVTAEVVPHAIRVIVPPGAQADTVAEDSRESLGRD